MIFTLSIMRSTKAPDKKREEKKKMENVLSSLFMCALCTLMILVPEWDFSDVIDMAFFVPTVFGMTYFAWNTGVEIGKIYCHKKPRH